MNFQTLCMAAAISIIPAAAVQAQVSFGLSVSTPGVSIGINVPSYPLLVQVPGYPVYYDPQASANYFFYDGLYWVYSNDNWYASSWYNGPWQLVYQDHVPLFVLRVPVRYYRVPPPYFYGWRPEAPPRWGDHWGHDWERRRPGWDRWDSRNIPRLAPLPAYQQKYPGNRYPGSVDRQRAIRGEHDRYQPHESVNRQILGQPDRRDDQRRVPRPQAGGQPGAPIPATQPVTQQRGQPVQIEQQNPRQPHNAQVAPEGWRGLPGASADQRRGNRGNKDSRSDDERGAGRR